MGIRFFVGLLYFLAGSMGFLRADLGLPYEIAAAAVLAGAHVVCYRTGFEFRAVWLGLIIATNLAIQLSGGVGGRLFWLAFIFGPMILARRHDLETLLWVLLSSASLAVAAYRSPALHPEPAIALFVLSGLIFRMMKASRDELRAAQTTMAYYEARDSYLTRRDAGAAVPMKEALRYSQIERPITFFLRFIHQSFRGQSSCLFGLVREREGEPARLALISGVSEAKHFAPRVTVETGEGFVGMVAKERREILIKDYYERSAWLGYYSGEVRVRSVLGAPVVFGQELEGVIVVDRREDPFTEEDREMLRAAAVTFAHLLGMLRSYEKKSFEASYFSALYELVKRLQRELTLEKILDITLAATMEVLGCDTVAAAAAEAETNQGRLLAVKSKVKSPLAGQVGRSFPLEAGLVGWVASLGGYLIKDDLKPGQACRCWENEGSSSGRSFLGVPLKDETRVIGVIWAESRVRKKFGEEDAGFMGFVAAQLSLAWIRANLYHQVQELSIRDGLTGLYNHRQFQEILKEAVTHNRELCLLLVDVDHFKSINDRFGHPIGDEVLKTIARIINESPGSAARYGGEEFALVLPGHSLKKGAEIAIKIRDRLRKQMFRAEAQDFSVTISIGLSHCPKDAADRAGLIEKADAALYRAKRSGRDRVVLAHRRSGPSDQLVQ